MSIITKFILFFLAIFLVISVGIFYFILGYSENSLKQQVFEDLTVLAETEEGYILSFMENIKGRVVDFSSDGLIRDYASQIIAKKNDKNLVSQFDSHLRNNKQSVDPTIMGILIVDVDGNIIASTDDKEVGKNELNDDYFQNVVKSDLKYGSAYISDVIYNEHFSTNDPVLMIMSPIFSVDRNTKLGYIINQISLSEVNKVLSGVKQIELGAPSGIKGRRTSINIYLVNKDNLLISPSIYKNLGILKEKINSPLVDACHRNKETTEIYKNHFDIEVLSASMCLPIHGWTLLTEMSSEEAFSLISNLRMRILIFGGLFLLALIIISTLFLYYFIIKSILKLREGARIVGAGNLNYEIKVKSNDEFGELAQDFNLMTKQLKESFNNLKLSSAKIKESEERYRIMFNGAVDAIFIADASGNFLEVNKNAEKITGYKENELLRMNHVQVYSKEDVLRCKEKLNIALQENTCFIENVNILNKSGDLLTVDIGISSLNYGGKKLLQFIVRDVSERAALEKHHKEIDHIKSQFINVVSHQLRTPLNSIRWNLEVLLGGDLGTFKKEQEKFLKAIYLNNQNIITIIADLFLALEIEESKIELEKEIIDLDVLMGEVAEGFKNSLLIKKIKINIAKPKKGLILNIEADRNKLIQVFSRLIDNAIKYNKEGGEINVSFSKINDYLVVSIADNGIGIPKDEQAALFSKFFRASNAAVMYPNASGLGLFISQKIIEAHGGQIWFESVEGKGTTFHVSLSLLPIINNQ